MRTRWKARVGEEACCSETHALWLWHLPPPVALEDGRERGHARPPALERPSSRCADRAPPRQSIALILVREQRPPPTSLHALSGASAARNAWGRGPRRVSRTRISRARRMTREREAKTLRIAARALFDALLTDGHAALACYASAPADVLSKRDAGVPPCVCVRRRRSGLSRAVHARARWVARCVSTGACVRAATPACLLQPRGRLVFVDAEHTPPYRTCYPAQPFARCSLSFQSRRG